MLHALGEDSGGPGWAALARQLQQDYTVLTFDLNSSVQRTRTGRTYRLAMCFPLL